MFQLIMNSKQFIKSALLWAIIGVFSFVIIFFRPSWSLNADVLQPQENLWDVVVLPKSNSLVINLQKPIDWAQYEWLFFWDSTQADVDFSKTQSKWDVNWEDVWPWAKKFVVKNLQWSNLITVPVSWSAEMIVISDVKSFIWNDFKSLSITNR